MSLNCFECHDGTKIHYSNVRELVMYYIDYETPVVMINGHRIINSKHNKKVSKLTDKWLVLNRYKTIVTYEKMEDDIDEESL